MNPILPQKISDRLWPVVGHEGAVHLLQQSVEAVQHDPTSRRGPKHAYLLLGARQVGKTTLSRAFAQALLCTDNQQRPCGVCRACRLLQKGHHPDLRLVQPLDKTGAVDRIVGMLRAEQAAEVIHDVALRPMESAYKLFIIQDAQSANDTFANKLLKTLEEPPDYAVFCLTALDRASLLPTIVSRCQILELRPLAQKTVADALVATWGAETAQADLLARLAGGRLGWAVQQLAQGDQLQSRLQRLQELWQLLKATAIERLAFAERLAGQQNAQQIFALLEIWTAWWRDLLLVQAGCVDLCTNIDQKEVLIQQAAQLSNKVVQEYLAVLKRLEGYLHHTINVRLALEVLLLRMPQDDKMTK